MKGIGIVLLSSLLYGQQLAVVDVAARKIVR
jgi:hypothetical protein